jgi:hypothetical protein
MGMHWLGCDIGIVGVIGKVGRKTSVATKYIQDVSK